MNINYICITVQNIYDFRKREEKVKGMKRLRRISVFVGILAAGIIIVLLQMKLTALAEEREGLYCDNGEWHYYINGEIDYDYNGLAVDKETDNKYWFDYGVLARQKEVYNPYTDTWYWFEADGSMAVDKDVFIPVNEEYTDGKWVRYDSDGNMIKGEDFRYGGWYWFDLTTGEMKKGFAYIPDGTDDGKWVYYDEINGQMYHGESYINEGWYRFDDVTGKMQHGEFSSEEGNRYLYNEITGIMQKGEVCKENNWYYYDEITGIMQKGEVHHHGNSYYYDVQTGIMQYGFVYRNDKWYYYNETTGVMENYNNVVVVLDPGHDSTHMGAGYYGLKEHEINLKIALACREELEKYLGVTVYLTHDTLDCPFAGSSIKEDLTQRTEYAASVGASLFVSLHNNAGKELSGFEIYYPNSNYVSEYNEIGHDVSECIAAELRNAGINQIGLYTKDSEAYYDDGTNWYPDGSRADYYNVIRNSKYNGITGIIVEHAYMDNEYDVENFLSDDEMLIEMGKADARGIAAYYGLRRN